MARRPKEPAAPRAVTPPVEVSATAPPEASAETLPASGKTGEGARSALAQLISQEQARVLPHPTEDGPAGPEQI